MEKTDSLFNIMSRAMHDIWALNMRTTAAAAHDLSATSALLMTARDPAQAFHLLENLGEPATEKMLAYIIRAKEIVTSAKNSIALMAAPGDDANHVPHA